MIYFQSYLLNLRFYESYEGFFIRVLNNFWPCVLGSGFCFILSFVLLVCGFGVFWICFVCRFGFFGGCLLWFCFFKSTLFIKVMYLVAWCSGLTPAGN